MLCLEHLSIVAAAICERIDAEDDLESVGVLHTPEELLAEAQRLKPDVVLLDLYYGGRDAFDELRALTEAAPEVGAVVISSDNHPDTIRRAFEAGARGYVLKGTDMADIVAAIRAVSAGKLWRPGAENETDRASDAMIAALGDPVTVKGRTWTWQVGRLHIEARAEPGGNLIIDLPWPLRSIDEPPSFGQLHEETGGEVKLRFAVANLEALELVLGVIAYERRQG